MTTATICIPSNRSLIKAVEPLWSAINYAQANGMRVVISDNSGEADKRDYFASTPSHVIFIPNGPKGPAENVLSALDAADSDFVLVLGDDDTIEHREGAAPFDFGALGDDVIGVKPRIELLDADKRITDVNDFAIDGADAASRVVEYAQKMRGGNSSYYSFFRTAPFRANYRLFLNHHPSKAGNADFSLVFALLAGGRMVQDPDTTIRYDNSRWADIESASRAMSELFAAAGLTETARPYMLVFHFLDTYVLMFRGDSSLPLIERYKGAYAVAIVFLKRFLARTRQNPFDYQLAADLLGPFEQAVDSDDPDLDRIFHIAGLIIDRVKPGLKALYDQYLLASAGQGAA